MSQKNFHQFIGRLAKDVEMQYLPTGTPLAKITLAVDEREYVDEEWKDTTLWVDLHAFGNLAERMNKVLRKGTLVSVTAKYRKRRYEFQGQNRVAHEFITTGFDILVFPKNGERYEEDEFSQESPEEEEEYPF